MVIGEFLMNLVSYTEQQLTEQRSQPIRARYLGNLTGYQPIRDQCFLIQTPPNSLPETSQNWREPSACPVILKSLLFSTVLPQSPPSIGQSLEGSQ